MSDKLLFADLETVGLHGMGVLIQYAVGDGPITLYEPWKEPVHKTLRLIEWFMEHTVIGFNYGFDHFHLSKLYTTFLLCPPDWIPEEHINEIAELEVQAQDGPCLKPYNTLDLMLHSRKTEFQALMARSDIRIRRVPTILAGALRDELEKRVQIDGIFFAAKSDPEAPRWHCFPCKKRDGSFNPDFMDVVLKFSPAGGLKYLAEYALKYKPKFHYSDIEIAAEFVPKDKKCGYAPFAMAWSSPAKNWEIWAIKDGKRVFKGYAWPGVIKHHIDHWHTNTNAREYASDDIKITRDLYKYFGCPAAGDNDSVLACAVASVRWKGYSIDKRGIKKLLKKAKAAVKNSPVDINKVKEVRAYLKDCLDDLEYLVIEESTKKRNIEEIANYAVGEPEECAKCEGKGCARCNQTGTLTSPHPAAVRAKKILEIKHAYKEIELYRKLLKAGKFHASFRVIGTLSSRMAGADGLNAQGIKKTTEVRIVFSLSPTGYELSLGDFSSFELTLADAVYQDPKFRQALIGSKKIIGLFGTLLYPGKTYEQIIASDGTDNDMYTKAKSALYAKLYGGDYNTIVSNQGVPEADAKAADATWNSWFPDMAKGRQKTSDAFQSMKQPGGIGTQVIWHDPAEFVESFLGFRRYFTLENNITHQLFKLAQSPPKGWREHKMPVMRRDKVQTAGGAAASALYGAAFQIQAANQRAAINHQIQSPGADITKHVQRKLWDLQPVGVHPIQVLPANVHDEILCPHLPEMREPVANVIKTEVESFRGTVPLIGMTWVMEGSSWADKKGKSGNTMQVKPDLTNL